MLIYLHGFRSSPQSFKSELLEQYCQKQNIADMYACPQLPVSPAQAIQSVRDQFSLTPQDTLIGSSLGGYYATWLAEATGCRAVLINPAVNPARDLAPYVGPLRTYHDDQPMELLEEHIQELENFSIGSITFAKRYFLIAAKGDEVLDWREMVAHYPGVQTELREGSDHGLSEFDEHIDQVIEFAGLKPDGHV
jgi:predicted esterase YcpF (UPF0227 family)